MKVDTSGEVSNLDYVQPMENSTAISRDSASNYNAENFVPVRKSSRENYYSVEIVTYLDEVMEVVCQL